MIAHHVHDAIAQVRRLQELLLDRSLFEGYSGKARLLSGFLALANALLLSSPRVPATPRAHLVAWAVTLGLALIFNYTALAWWFLTDPEVRRNPRRLRPALDAFPAFLMGAALSWAIIRAGSHGLLFGVWMSTYGLAQMAYRRSLPAGIYWVGLAYLGCGVACLMTPSMSFFNPWPMGLMFLVGEMVGGTILIQHDAAEGAPHVHPA
jgi:hypothetical protein